MALLDKGTFPWYKRDNGGGVKSLILRGLRALPDNPFLGTKSRERAQRKYESMSALHHSRSHPGGRLLAPTQTFGDVRFALLLWA
jgi:hypothetical protein